jgi:hypothetical protein
MLVTNTDWEETHPGKRSQLEPYKGWRFMAWTGETASFWVIPSRDLRNTGDHPIGWLVGGPEALLEAAAELDAGTFTVYVLDPAEDDGAPRLCQVTGLWRMDDPVAGVTWFWYATDAGGLRPCTSTAPIPGNRLELVSELVFDRRSDRRS